MPRSWRAELDVVDDVRPQYQLQRPLQSFRYSRALKKRSSSRPRRTGRSPRAPPSTAAARCAGTVFSSPAPSIRARSVISCRQLHEERPQHDHVERADQRRHDQRPEAVQQPELLDHQVGRDDARGEQQAEQDEQQQRLFADRSRAGSARQPSVQVSGQRERGADDGDEDADQQRLRDHAAGEDRAVRREVDPVRRGTGRIRRPRLICSAVGEAGGDHADEREHDQPRR